MTTALEAIERLKEGNRRFVAGRRRSGAVSPHRRTRLAAGQAPFAAILGCSDSRVPAELVFDQGLGDLFVIRVAGNVAAPSQVGSVEFAASMFGVELAVVLGHTRCGAIEAVLKEPDHPPGNPSANLEVVLDRIRPAVRPLRVTAPDADHDTLVRHAVRANVRAQVDGLVQGSEILGQLVEAGRLMVVGAEYDLVTGEVDFLDFQEGSAP